MITRRPAVLLLVGFLASCGDAEAPRPEPAEEAVRVLAQRVAYEPDARVVEAVGTARARRAAVLRPQTGGEVEAVLFATGDRVEAGTPLVRLEDEEEALAVRLARVAVQEAEQLLARYRRIEGTGAVSGSAIDEARTALEAARIEQEQAELALARRTVRAPFAGTVGLTEVDPGARVTPETEITRLDDRRVLYVDFPVPEEVFGRLLVGDAVDAQPFSEGAPRRAEVVGLDNQVDRTTRSFTARAEIDNADDRLRPGMSFRVGFAVQGRAYPSVPEAAIVWGGDGAYLWAVEDGAARRVPVAIVSRGEGRVLVDADLPEGGMIVAEGVQKVREGAPVEAVRTERREGASSSVGASGASGL